MYDSIEYEEDEDIPDENTVPEKNPDTRDIIDDDILEMLGEDPQKSKALNINIHESLRRRWNYWITHGLEKKVKDELTEKYARSTEFDAPKLNAEMSAILSEAAVKRDNFMLKNQRLAGSALTAIGSVLTMIMTEEDVDKIIFVQRLNEAAKLVLAIHHNETESRKAFIYPGVKKQFQTVLKDTRPDSLLFGDKLADKIKESHHIEKLSQNVKYQSTPTHQSGRLCEYSRPEPSSAVFQDQGTSQLKGADTPELQIIQTQQGQINVGSANRLQYFLPEWQEITENKFVLDCIQGYRIQFQYRVFQDRVPIMKFNSWKEIENYGKAIQVLLDKGAIQSCKPKNNSYRPTSYYKNLMDRIGLF